ncbi:MAG: hypothetical protein FJX80_01395 [Bacteroidetes bacterium]|nr:hypothetical protein [Bacteroidota bacterium]
MNRLVVFVVSSIIFSAISACDLMKDVTYVVTPNPLELKGDNLEFSVDVTIPEKGISKKVRAELAPTLGSTTLGTWEIQGEKVTGNGTSISFQSGGVAKFDMKIPYTPDMEAADLVVSGKVFKGKKEKSKEAIASIKIADATIITPLLVNRAFKTITIPDKLERKVQKVIEAKINFARGKFEIRPNEMKDADIVEMLNWVKKNQKNPKIEINSIEIKGYASPDGEELKNTDLSKNRAEAGKNAIIGVFKKEKIALLSNASKYTTSQFGEDFEGFKKQLALSKTIDDNYKALFIRAVEMQGTADQKEQMLKDLGKSYENLEKEVFPAIRRTVIVLTYTETGLTDDELRTRAVSSPSSLTVEELLFTAEKLITNVNDKVALYSTGIQMYAADPRVQNNSGVALFLNSKFGDALAAFEKANQINPDPVTSNNLAASAMINGDRADARKLITQARKNVSAENSADMAYNAAILDLLDGNYPAAVSGFSGASFNKALSEVLSGKLELARTTLKQVSADAMTNYLSAIIAARSGESVDAVVNHLKNAFAMNPNLKSKASKDREFLKFMKDQTFTSAVN